MVHAPPPPDRPPAAQPRLLLLEFWGLGDLTFATAFIAAAITKYAVTIAGKAHAEPLLGPTFPGVAFVSYDPPWTAFRGKYKFLRWNWSALGTMLRRLREKHFEVAVSVRHDPRDHLLMSLAGARTRVGFGAKGSSLLLTESLELHDPKAHRVERWRALGETVQLPGIQQAAPRLAHEKYRTARLDSVLEPVRRPILCLHTGARLPTRRWPEAAFASIIARLRAEFDFHLLLVPDPDGYGQSLESIADTTLRDLSVGELVDLLGRVNLLLCNDSGPAHIAAACGRPVIPVFGPTDPDWFHPWGNRANVVIRDICPWRPCFDYCKFREPHCLTKLSADEAWRDIEARLEALLAAGTLPEAFKRKVNVAMTA